MYKYNAPNNFKHIFENKTVRFTQPAFFNDPFECRPVVKSLTTRQFAENRFEADYQKLLREALKKIPKTRRKEKRVEMLSQRAEYKEKVVQIMMNDRASSKDVESKIHFMLNDLLGIFCLSIHECEPLMWAHYGKDHQGFLIEFDPENDFFFDQKSKSDDLRYLEQVTYIESRIHYTLDTLTVDSLFRHKSNKWEYEGEFRMVKALKDLDYNEEKKSYTEPFPFSAVKRVVFGINCSPADLEKYSNIIRNEHKHIKLQQAVLSEDAFEIFYDDL